MVKFCVLTFSSNINTSLFQMLLDVLEVLELKSPIIFYYDESDILLWKSFVEREGRTNFRPPKLIRLSTKMDDYELM